MANEITLNFTLRFSKGGLVVQGSLSDTLTQAGNDAIGNVHGIGATTEAIDLGDVTGDKYLMFQNRDATATIYIDKVTPVVPGAGTGMKLLPGASLKGGHAFFQTTTDTWYGISSAGTPDLLVV